MASTYMEKELAIGFVSAVNVFMKQEIIDMIPDNHFINIVKENFRWSNKGQTQDAATIISEEIITQIIKNRKDKDPFV